MNTTDLISKCKYVLYDNDIISYALELSFLNRLTCFPVIDCHGNYLCTCSVFELIQYSKNDISLKIHSIIKHLKRDSIKINDELCLDSFESKDILYVCDDFGKLIGEISKDKYIVKYIDMLDKDCIKYKEQYEQEKNINKAILDSMHDGVYLTDGNGYTLYVNDAYTKISGIRKERLIGKHATQLIAEGIYLDSASLEVIDKKKPVTMIDHFKDGRQNRTEGRRCLLSSSPVFDDNGNVIRVITNVRDVSELMEIQLKLEEYEALNNKYIIELEKLRENYLKHPEIIAKSKSMVQIIKKINIISCTDAKVLVLGETGVGKEVVVKEIHNSSLRKNGPFIKVNCGAIPENLFESELFGYEKGAFTGASNKGKPGMFELADGGTIFLDEIAELPRSVQSKLLRVLNDGEVLRVGGVNSIKVNVRVISATNKDLKELVKEGKFREDLYYRLNVISIYIPPLRERKEDIPYLLNYFIDYFNKEYNKNKIFTQDSVKLIEQYEWLGNVRELRNFIERLVIISESDIIDEESVLKNFTEIGNDVFINSNSFYNMKLEEATSILEKRMLKRALEKYQTTRKVADILGVSQPTIVRKCKKYNIKFDKLPND
ncbi:MAG: sigma 54-interacting transcriptional regulator [Clostridiaceae bacterium]|nr:sigma 54-interacting transcriptional regulator [Clostridiaceae bacterium]